MGTIPAPGTPPVSREAIRAALELLGIDSGTTTWVRIETERILWGHVGPSPPPADAIVLPTPPTPADAPPFQRTLMRLVESS